MKIALAQINTTVGDFAGNVAKIRAGIERGRAEGVELATKMPWAAVLMDLQMPGIDGFETVRRIRRRLEGRHLPIIALTATVRLEDRIASEEAGMDAFLTKPVRQAELRACLERWIKPRV